MTKALRVHNDRTFQGLCRQRPADWGVGVTICIAALSQDRIILATDQMIAVESASADVALKIRALNKNWIGMFAGDIEHFDPIVRDVKAEIGESDCTVTSLSGVFTAAYQRRRQKEIENRVLSSYDLTWDEFKREGATIFKEWFNTITTQIEHVTLGSEPLELMVAGFDADGPHLFSIEHPGADRHHDTIGFHVIGSGANSALGLLYFHAYNRRAPVAVNTYRVCQARFFARGARGVGRETSLVVWTRDMPIEFRKQTIEEIREHWEKAGAPSIPSWVDEVIGPLVESKTAVAGKTQRVVF